MLFYIYDFFFGGFKDGVCLVWFSYLVNVAILFGPGFSAIVFFKLMFYLTRWVKLNDLNFDIINWSVKDKFIDILH